MQERSPTEKQKLGRTSFLGLFLQCPGAILPTLCSRPSFAADSHHCNSFGFGCSFQHRGRPLFQLQQSSLSPICRSYSILLEIFFPVVCTSHAGAALAATEEVWYIPSTVTAFQPTERASGRTHHLALRSPLPANTWGGGRHLRSWSRWWDQFEYL